ncbi:MAG TPA: dihydroxyacetone kinase subunit DhaL [Actinomycetota bacterium]|nr:dihydroxyacetone kinase subunit DhaL [Actinomycetota bacterium]
MTAVDAAFVRRWLDALGASIEEQRGHLTELDSAIGDADHGTNMHRGFTAVRERLSTADAVAPGALLTLAGTTLISKVGGASGPLYGTCLRNLGKALGDAPEIDARALLEGLRAGLAGIQKLGRAELGDKTIVDAFAPALDALERALDDGASLPDALRAASDAAEEGAKATIPLQARKGRASYLGERSAGHQDPGATSTALLFAALEHAASSS